jgi:hypothetical protein
MALFGRDYDETYRTGNRSNRGYWGGTNTSGWRTGGDPYGGYGANTPGWRSNDRFGTDRFGTDRYGTDYNSNRFGSTYDRGYDRGYKSRWETDYGDPFGDRQQHTPMRVIRGEAHGYDRDFWSNDYDRNFRGGGYPMGYRPYSARAGYDNTFANDRSFRNRNYGRGYDRGWY